MFSRTFFRALAVAAVLQFIITRARAGRAEIEGAAEQMWMLYPVNVLLNAMLWTAIISTAGRFARAVRRAG